MNDFVSVVVVVVVVLMKTPWNLSIVGQHLRPTIIMIMNSRRELHYIVWKHDDDDYEGEDNDITTLAMSVIKIVLALAPHLWRTNKGSYLAPLRKRHLEIEFALNSIESGWQFIMLIVDIIQKWTSAPPLQSRTGQWWAAQSGAKLSWNNNLYRKTTLKCL